MNGRQHMDIEPEDQQVVELLNRLKTQGGTYPQKMLASRRRAFLSQMASIGAGFGIGTGIHAATRTSKTGSIFHALSVSASSLVETVLVVAIVVQAGFIAFTYRDRIIEILNSLSAPGVPTAVSIPVIGSTLPEVITSGTPVVEESLTLTPTDTPTTTVTVVTATSAGNSDQGTDAVETPQPANDDPGNHYGQTPKPEQTKKTNESSDVGGDSGGNNGSEKKNNKP